MPRKKNQSKKTKKTVIVRVASAKAERNVLRRTPKVRANGPLTQLGTALGGIMGYPALGRSAGSFLGRITGMGDYKVSQNSVSMPVGSPPLFANVNGTVIAHREYLGDIKSSILFSSAEYTLNPGNLKTFPWLSSIATNFEKYEFLGLVFEFKSTSADALNSTNTALGTVVMATEYDTYDASFVSKIQMDSHKFSSSAAPSLSSMHPVECDPRDMPTRLHYISSVSPNAGQLTGDQRLSDWGRFTIATEGMQAVSTIGELWVTYHVRLHDPAIPNNYLVNSPTIHWRTYPNATYPFNNPIKVTGTVGFTPVLYTNNIGSLPSGTYLIAVTQAGQGAMTYSSNSPATIANDSLGAVAEWKDVWWQSTTPSAQFLFTGNTGAYATSAFIGILKVNRLAGNTLYFAPPASITGSTYGDVYITQIPEYLYSSSVSTSMADRLLDLEKLVQKLGSTSLENSESKDSEDDGHLIGEHPPDSRPTTPHERSSLSRDSPYERIRQISLPPDPRLDTRHRTS